MGKQQPKDPSKMTDEEILRLFGKGAQKKNLSQSTSTPSTGGGQGPGNGSQSRSGSIPGLPSADSVNNPYQKVYQESGGGQNSILQKAGPKDLPLPNEVNGQQDPAAVFGNLSSPEPTPQEQENFYREARQDIKLANMDTFDKAMFYGGQVAGNANKYVYREIIPNVLNFLGDVNEGASSLLGDEENVKAFKEAQDYYSKTGIDPTSWYNPDMRILADKYRKMVDESIIGESAYGALDPDFDQEWYSQLGTTLGQGISMILTRRASAPGTSLVLKSPNAVTSAFNSVTTQMVQPGSIGMGAGIFDQAYQSAKQDLLDQGATDEEAINGAFMHALRVTAVSQPLEAIPFSKMFNRINKATGGFYKNRLMATVGNGFEQGVEEATTETIQQAYQNMDYKNAINDTKDITEGLLDSAFLGFMGGGTFGSVSTAISYRKAVAETPEEKAQWQKAQEIVNENEARFQEIQQNNSNIKQSFGATMAMRDIQQIVDNKQGNWTPEEMASFSTAEKAFNEQFPEIGADVDKQTSGISQKIQELTIEKSGLFKDATTPDQIQKAKQRENEIDSEIASLIKQRTNIKTDIVENQYYKKDLKENETLQSKQKQVPEAITERLEEKTEAPTIQEGQELEKQPVKAQPKSYNMKVGITSATESIPEVKQYMSEARQAHEEGNIDKANDLYNKVLDIGEQEIKNQFKDIPEVKFKLNRTKGNFFGYTEPTFQAEFIVPADKTSQFQERLFNAAESLKQENVHVSNVLPYQEGVEYGTEQEDGSVYEPDYIFEFNRPISDQEYAELSKEIQSIGKEEGDPLAGSTLLPDKNGINLYNISKFKDHGKFEQQVGQLAEVLHKRRLLKVLKHSIRKIWNTGNKEYGATRTYQERRAEISGTNNSGAGQVNDSSNQSGIQSDLGIGQESQPSKSIEGGSPKETSPSGVLQASSEEGDVAPEKEITPPPTVANPATEENATPKKERKTIKRLTEDPNVRTEVKEAFSEDTKFYETTSLHLEEAEADAIIKAKGLENVIAELISPKNKMDDHNFTMLQIKSIEGLNKIIDEKTAKGESISDVLTTYDNVAQALGDNATRTAQNLNRYKVFAKYHKLYYLNSVEKDIKRDRKKVISENQSSIKEKTEAINKINEQAIDQATKKAIAKVKKIKDTNQKKIKDKTPKVISHKKEQIKKAKDEAKQALDRLFREMTGRASAGVDPVITAKIVAQASKYGYYTIAEGYYNFQEWAAKMKEELGDSVSPYLNDVWKSSFQGEKLESVASQVKEYDVRYKTKQAILDNMEEKFSEIVKEHYTKVEKTKSDLTKKLLEGLDISEQDAKELSVLIQSTFDSLVKQRKAAALSKTLVKSPKEITSPKKTKQLFEKIIEQSNLGALDEKQTAELYADYFGMPKLTDQQRAKILELSDKVQKAKGDRERNKATQDLLSYQESINGINWSEVAMSVWYANVLSGYKTHIVNNAANAMNIGGEAIVSSIYNPKNFPMIMKGLIEGAQIGWKDAYDTFTTGYDPYKTSKIDTPNILERFNFKGGKFNPGNYLKYVRRFMTASDVLAFNMSKRMRMYEWAAQKARNEAKNDTTVNIENRVNEIMNQTSKVYAAAISQAKEEGIKPKSKEFKRRVFEIMESGIDENAIEDATDFGLETTFNQNPYGALGFLTDQIASVSEKASLKGFKPLKFVIPFTRVIANVANSYINWSPWGAVRALKGGVGLLSPERYQKQYTETERHKTLIKSILGTIAMGALWYLTEPDDENQSEIMITADGTGDLDKNYQLAKEGWMKYSMSFDGGKTWVSYQNTPMYLPLAFIGWARDQQRYNGKKMDDKDFQEALFMGGFRTARFITDMTFLQSFSDMMEAYNSNNMEVYMKKLASSSVRVFVVPNAYSQFVRDYSQYNQIPQKQSTTFWEGLYKDIPVLNEPLYPMVDQVGDDISPDPDRFFSTPVPKDAATEKVWDVITTNQAWVGRISLPKLESDLRQAGYTGDVTGEQYYNFMKLRGKYIKEGILDAMEGWRDFSKTEIQKEVDKIKREATKEAKYEIFFEDNVDYAE